MKVTINPTINEFYRVAQDEVAITPISEELRTGGISTCSALIITGGGKQLLSHIDAGSNIRDLEQAISNNFDLHAPSFKATVIPGDGGFGSTEHSETIAYKTLGNLDIDYTIERGVYTSSFMELVVANGHYKEDSTRKHSTEILERNGARYLFTMNVRPENIEDSGNGDVKLLSPGMNGYVYKNAVVGRAKGLGDEYIGIYQREDMWLQKKSMAHPGFKIIAWRPTTGTEPPQG